MNIGDVVRNKTCGTYGSVEYSTFGYSIHFWNEEHNALGKTLGDSKESIEKYWEKVDIPKEYEIHEYGGIRKEVTK
jgi:hypothetical protein